MEVIHQTAYEEVLDFLSSTPTPEQLVSFRPSSEVQQRLQTLLEKNQEGNLSEQERIELDEFAKVEHFMRLLKAKARQKLKNE